MVQELEGVNGQGFRSWRELDKKLLHSMKNDMQRTVVQ